jgi:CheY-like chemotaxis protein
MQGMATILVADDNRANRDAMAALLETAGHRVLSSADGREAFERAREHRPDLVISDVLMPEMDGYELARRLQLDPATAGTVVMSARRRRRTWRSRTAWRASWSSPRTTTPSSPPWTRCSRRAPGRAPCRATSTASTCA